jgi:hypothetical protein
MILRRTISILCLLCSLALISLQLIGSLSDGAFIFEFIFFIIVLFISMKRYISNYPNINIGILLIPATLASVLPLEALALSLSEVFRLGSPPSSGEIYVRTNDVLYYFLAVLSLLAVHFLLITLAAVNWAKVKIK